MDNPKTMEEVLSQAKKIDENNWNSSQYLNSINMMLSSNDLARSKDKGLSEKFQELNSKMDDINKLTSSLLDELSKKHN